MRIGFETIVTPLKVPFPNARRRGQIRCGGKPWLHRELAQSFAVSNLDTQLSFMLAFAVASDMKTQNFHTSDQL
ncbi:hypothetical protein CY35_14G032900 [Sphagnum magellanicum]|nr:hypothetical protein CY35_14G032900 [Sphagnum magellanicum]